VNRRGVWSVSAVLLLATSCREQQPAARAVYTADADTSAICDAHARHVVERFGARFKLVSRLAPDTILKRSLRSAYSPFVTPELLAEWEARPRSAPGREVSNPWPARIAIRSMHAEGKVCIIEGDVVYVATGDTATVLELRPIRLHVQESNGLRIGAYQATHHPGQ
jgi:hypothetical protein